LAEVIEAYFGDGNKFGVNISYFREEKPLGTTGGIKEIENKLTDDFLVLYGDVMVDMDLDKLINFHKEKNGISTLVIHPNDHPFDSDLVEIDRDQKIVKFHSKPHDENKHFRNLVNAALYVFSPSILNYIEKDVKADFGKNIFPELIEKENLYGYNTAEYLKDMGTLDRLEMVTKDYLNGKINRLNNENKRKAIFLDRDGTLNKSVDQLHKIEDFQLLPNSAKAVKEVNGSEFLVIVVTNQSIIARNLCSIKDLEEIHKKMETLLGKEGAKLDGVYYCPHHPDKGYPEENVDFKIDCECRKPKIGMIKQAEKDFNIDLENSFIIGDSKDDINCGKNAGLTTVGVKTGIGYGDSDPDYEFENLFEAIEKILKNNSS
jgi:mannose-1-phosphate guanylyltransferase / phosphomannomutase